MKSRIIFISYSKNRVTNKIKNIEDQNVFCK